ncbi:hypothetical protein SAVIM338S_06540 [Streptomyces avidinii]
MPTTPTTPATPLPARTAKGLATRIWRALNRPAAAVLGESDNLLVQLPEPGSVWPCGSRQLVTWWLVGPAGESVDVELVTRAGTQARTAAVLATGIGTNDQRAAVTVPDLPPGTYWILVTSDRNMLDAYAGPVTIPAP